jgi:hypothetical protein
MVDLKIGVVQILAAIQSQYAQILDHASNSCWSHNYLELKTEYAVNEMLP